MSRITEATDRTAVREAAKRRQAEAGPPHGPGAKSSASVIFTEPLKGDVGEPASLGRELETGERTHDAGKLILKAGADSRWAEPDSNTKPCLGANGAAKQIATRTKVSAATIPSRASGRHGERRSATKGTNTPPLPQAPTRHGASGGHPSTKDRNYICWL